VRDELTRQCVPVERCSASTVHHSVPGNTTVMVITDDESSEEQSEAVITDIFL
jgi:hypothetical protein